MNYVGKKGNKVPNEEEFTKMKEHLIKYYRGIEVLHSFVDGGSVFDCIPTERQPSLRDSGKKLARIPEGPVIDKTGATKNTNRIQAEPNRKDRFGNTMFCPSGTCPFRRTTLEQLARFETLRQFFRKSPLDPDANLHRWALYGQYVDNLGGHSILSVQYPFVDTSAGQQFSLGQQWYVSGDREQQTAEVGWMVCPSYYGDSFTHLFVSWTAHNYHSTGCQNMDCVGFVHHPGSAWAQSPGRTLPPLGLPVPNFDIDITVRFTEGNWWVYVNGGAGHAVPDPDFAVGYFDVSIYNNGPMATKSTAIKYGGEVAVFSAGNPFAPMGNGNRPGESGMGSAYHNDIWSYIYRPTPPITRQIFRPQYYEYTPGTDAGLGPCYSVYADPGPYNKFYFGGPGGNACGPASGRVAIGTDNQ